MLNIGDRVKVIDAVGNTDYFRELFIGKIGTVSRVNSIMIWSIDVEFNESIFGSKGMCFNENELELIDGK
jgi:hypothetical protein